MANVYSIGVSIALQNNVSSVLKVIQRDVLGLHRQVSATRAGFSRMKLAVGGAFALAGGLAMLGVMGKLTDAAEEYNRQLVLMRQAGMTAPEIAGARAAANRTSDQVRVSAPTENLQLVRELRGVFGNVREATDFLPEFAKAGALLRQMTGSNDPHALQTIAKAIDLRGGVMDARGQINPAAFRGELDEALKTLVAGGGLIKPQDLFGVMQQAGPMARMMDAKVFYDTMMPAIMEMGGRRAGTALSAIGRAVYGGVTPQRNALEFMRLGLLDPSLVHVRRGGHVTTDPGAFRGADVMNKQGMLPYVEQVLRPALERAGFTNTNQQQQELYRLFPTETARRLIGLFLQQGETVRRHQALRGQATGVSGYDAAAAQSFGMARQAFSAQLHRLTTDLGMAITPTVVTMMNALAGALAYVSRVVEPHPTATRYILLTLGGIALALTAAGGIALAVAASGFLGLSAGTVAIVAGIAAALSVLLSAMADFGPAAWAWTRRAVEAVRGWITGVGSALGRWVRTASDYLAAAMVNIGDLLGRLWRTITGRLSTLATDIWKSVTGLADALVAAFRALLAKIAALPGAVFGGLAQPLTRQQQEQQGRLLGPQYGAPHDGFDEQGRPVPQPQSLRVAPAREHVIHASFTIPVMLDGREVGRAVTTHQTRAASRPSAGPTGFNLGIGLPTAGVLT